MLVLEKFCYPGAIAGITVWVNRAEIKREVHNMDGRLEVIDKTLQLIEENLKNVDKFLHTINGRITTMET